MRRQRCEACRNLIRRQQRGGRRTHRRRHHGRRRRAAVCGGTAGGAARGPQIVRASPADSGRRLCRRRRANEARFRRGNEGPLRRGTRRRLVACGGGGRHRLALSAASDQLVTEIVGAGGDGDSVQCTRAVCGFGGRAAGGVSERLLELQCDRAVVAHPIGKRERLIDPLPH